MAACFLVADRGVGFGAAAKFLHYADRREISITGHVTREGRVQPGFGELRQALDLECEETQTEDGKIGPVRSGIRMGVYSPLHRK